MLRGNNIVYLGGGSIFIFYFLLSTFPFIKHYPDLVDTSKVFTSGVKFSRFVSVVNGAVFVLVGIGMTLWLHAADLTLVC